MQISSAFTPNRKHPISLAAFRYDPGQLAQLCLADSHQIPPLQSPSQLGTPRVSATRNHRGDRNCRSRQRGSVMKKTKTKKFRLSLAICAVTTTRIRDSSRPKEGSGSVAAVFAGQRTVINNLLPQLGFTDLIGAAEARSKASNACAS